MGEYVVRHARIYTPLSIIDDGYIVISGGVIKEIGREPYIGPIRSTINAEELIVTAGFIDTHIHGFRGYDVCDGSVESLEYMARELIRHGITSFMPTIPPAAHEDIIDYIRVIREAFDGWGPDKGSRIIGIHLEGPYITHDVGHPRSKLFIRNPSIDELRDYIRVSGGLLRQITIAPELPGALDLISYAVDKHIVVSIGHTNATYNEVLMAIDRGATKATHLYNAMRGIDRNEPGAVMALLTSPTVFLEMITDFIHVHPIMVKFTVDYAGVDRIVLVSDAVSVAGLPNGTYRVADVNIVVDKGVSRIAETKEIYGSVIALDRAIRNIRLLGYSLDKAFRMASYNPARSINALRRNRVGLLKQGYKADMVFLDKNLNVIMTVLEGEVVYEK